MKSIVVLILLVSFAACSSDNQANQQSADSVVVHTDSLPASDSTETNGIAFAFSDEAGRQLLSLDIDSAIAAKAFTQSLGKGGKLIPVAFKMEKPATENDNGRQTAQNFANTGGNLYKATSGTVNPEFSAILFTKGFLAARKLLTVTPAKYTLSTADETRLKTDKKRNIKTFHSLGQLSPTQIVGLVEFERQQDSVLVSLVVITPESIAYKDFPAKYDETSTWRVDDGGEFAMESYTLLAAFEHHGTLELVTEWIGAEGISIEYMLHLGKQLITRKESSRYTSPL